MDSFEPNIRVFNKVQQNISVVCDEVVMTLFYQVTTVMTFSLMNNSEYGINYETVSCTQITILKLRIL